MSIRINLLPHRAEKRKHRQAQFVALAALTALIGLVIAGAVYFLLAQRVEQQQERNKHIQTQIGKLEKQIEEIKAIRAETADLLQKKQVVENLQTYRSEPVYLLDQMLRLIPEGLYLTDLKQTGVDVEVKGLAQSQARIANFMNNIDASPYLQGASIVESAGTNVNNVRAFKFVLKFKIKRAAVDDGKGAAKKVEAKK
jgi:type IV pilus assembly protein PilN